MDVVLVYLLILPVPSLRVNSMVSTVTLGVLRTSFQLFDVSAAVCAASMRDI